VTHDIQTSSHAANYVQTVVSDSHANLTVFCSCCVVILLQLQASLQHPHLLLLSRSKSYRVIVILLRRLHCWHKLSPCRPHRPVRSAVVPHLPKNFFFVLFAIFFLSPCVKHVSANPRDTPYLLHAVTRCRLLLLYTGAPVFYCYCCFAHPPSQATQ
jgi:hypothetical protein